MDATNSNKHIFTVRPLSSSSSICRSHTSHIISMATNSWFEAIILSFMVAIFWAVGTTLSLSPGWSLLLPHKTRYRPTTMTTAPITLKIVQLPKLAHSHTMFMIPNLFPTISFNQMDQFNYSNQILYYPMNVLKKARKKRKKKLFCRHSRIAKSMCTFLSTWSRTEWRSP